MNTLKDRVIRDLTERGYDVIETDTVTSKGLRHGFCIDDPSLPGSPIFYDSNLIGWLDQGLNIPEMATEVLRATYTMKPPITEEQLKDEHFLRDHAKICVCNLAWHQDFAEQYHSTVRDDLGLIVYPRVYIDDQTSFCLPRSMDIDYDRLMEAAEINSHPSYTVRPLFEVLSESMGIELPDTGAPIMVVSNAISSHGAGAITDTDILDRACRKLDTDEIMVLPSSIHEVLAIPYNFAPAKDAANMIREINAAEVKFDDRLGDYPFRYSKKTKELTCLEAEVRDFEETLEEKRGGKRR